MENQAANTTGRRISTLRNDGKKQNGSCARIARNACRSWPKIVFRQMNWLRDGRIATRLLKARFAMLNSLTEERGCGHVIDKRRLANEPDTPFCVGCQRALEGESASPTV